MYVLAPAEATTTTATTTTTTSTTRLHTLFTTRPKQGIELKVTPNSDLFVVVVGSDITHFGHGCRSLYR